MESIIEEDENQLRDPCPQVEDGPLGSHHALQERREGIEIHKDATKAASSIPRLDPGQKSGSNGSTTMSSNFQLKNEIELSTMQTSNGFSNTRRSPSDPSFESNIIRQGGNDNTQLRLRPQLISSQNYKSLHQLRSTDRDNIRSFRPLPGANLTSNGFNNIIEEEEFAY